MRVAGGQKSQQVTPATRARRGIYVAGDVGPQCSTAYILTVNYLREAAAEPEAAPHFVRWE